MRGDIEDAVNPDELTEVTRRRLATRALLANRARRAAIGQDLCQRYEQGASLRQLARDTGYAYGTVRVLLTEAGAVLRTRGRPTEYQ